MRSLPYVIAVLIAGGIGVGPAQQARGAELPLCPESGVITQDCQLKQPRTKPLGIASNGVTVECNRQPIRRTPEFSAIGIIVGASHGVVLKDCWVEGFDKGIAVAGATNLDIRDPWLFGNRIGIEIRHTKGWVLVQSTKVVGALIMDNAFMGVDARFAEDVTLRGTHFAWMEISGSKYGARLSEIKKLTVQSVLFADNEENHLTYVWGSPTPPTPKEGGSPVIRNNKFKTSKVGLNIFTDPGNSQRVRLEDRNTCENNEIDIQFFRGSLPPVVAEAPDACHRTRAISE
jgi:hypothetical protein